MPTRAKIEAVQDLRRRLEGVNTVVLTDFRGLTVQELSELRRQLRAVAAQYKVVKNRLAKRALEATGLEPLRDHLRGPTGLVVSRNDPVAVARTLATFARAHQALQIKAGYVEGQVLEPNGVRALAELPTREGLRAQLVGAIQGPLAQLVGLLTAPHRDLIAALEQRGRGAE